MSLPNKKWWQAYVPNYASNPFALAWRLFNERKPAARSAMFLAAAGILATPFDMLFSRQERRLYARAQKSNRPIILVCGPPRGGTTLITQFLINNLDVCYLNNLTSVFPRSPIYANRLLGKFAKQKDGDYDAFYGKSSGLSGVNDALYIWDRWLGADRASIPNGIDNESAQQMREFFGAIEQLYGQPLVNKVNRLNTCASLVADAMPNVTFVCVRRDPLQLAQSLLIARSKIMGDSSVAYGVQHSPTSPDPVEDVCMQVRFHEKLITKQLEVIGEKRFIVVSYEEFCEEPFKLLNHCVDRIDGLDIRALRGDRSEKFVVSKSKRLPDGTIQRMQTILHDTGGLS